METGIDNNHQKYNILDEEIKYLDPKADVTFKLVFGGHPDLVMSLLNALLPLDEDSQITHVEYLSPEMVPENPGKKYSVVDVRCTDQKNRQFIVEMQLYWNPFFQQRVILNASKAVVKQLNKGEDYRLIQPVYCLSLINDIGFKSSPEEFYHDYAIINTEHPERRIEGLRFVFVELPKFTPKTFVEKKMAVLWLRFLTEIGEKVDNAPKELLDNALTSKALSIVKKSALTDSQLYAYEQFWRAVIDEQAIVEGSYIKGVNEGEARGIAKGRAEGRAEGRVEGRAEGMAEGMAKGEQNKTFELARKMKSKGYPIEEISEMTGLSVDVLLTL